MRFTKSGKKVFTAEKHPKIEKVVKNSDLASISDTSNTHHFILNPINRNKEESK